MCWGERETHTHTHTQWGERKNINIKAAHKLFWESTNPTTPTLPPPVLCMAKGRGAALSRKRSRNVQLRPHFSSASQLKGFEEVGWRGK